MRADTTCASTHRTETVHSKLWQALQRCPCKTRLCKEQHPYLHAHVIKVACRTGSALMTGFHQVTTHTGL